VLPSGGVTSGGVTRPYILYLQMQQLETIDLTADIADLTPPQVEEEVSRRLSIARSRLNGRLIVPHQRDGVQFLIRRELSMVKGSILADEMGLGKTVQMITTCLSDTSINPTLIVCDLSLVKQWEAEIRQYAPSMRCYVFSKKEFAALGATFIQSMSNCFIITTYGSLLNNGALIGADAVHFHRIIIDEAHKIKNRRSKIHQLCCQLKSDIRHAITGTPITKNRNDLVSLLVWTRLFFDVPHNNTTDSLRDSTRRYVLRRTFADLEEINRRLQLPELIIKNHSVTLSSEEKKLYNRLIQHGRFAMEARNNAIDSDEVRQINNHIFKILLRLQQCVVDHRIITRQALEDMHDNIFDTEAHFAAEIVPTDDCCSICMDDLSTDTCCQTECGHFFCQQCLRRVFEASHNSYARCPLCRAHLIPGTIRTLYTNDIGISQSTESSKMTKMREVLSTEIGHDKGIIFCHWKAEMEQIMKLCDEIGLKHSSIDGRMDMTQRNMVVRKFQDTDEIRVIICQIQTASCGLNLTRAKHVFFPSLDWTPAVHMQALARAHRIGQTAQVTVHYIIAEGTVDQHVINKQHLKLREASDVLDDERIMKKIGDIVEKRTLLFNILELLE